MYNNIKLKKINKGKGSHWRGLYISITKFYCSLNSFKRIFPDPTNYLQHNLSIALLWVFYDIFVVCIFVYMFGNWQINSFSRTFYIVVKTKFHCEIFVLCTHGIAIICRAWNTTISHSKLGFLSKVFILTEVSPYHVTLKVISTLCYLLFDPLNPAIVRPLVFLKLQ